MQAFPGGKTWDPWGISQASYHNALLGTHLFINSSSEDRFFKVIGDMAYRKKFMKKGNVDTRKNDCCVALNRFPRPLSVSNSKIPMIS